ncbi:MAG: ABC-2 family transporter protein, partial [Lachnospiraceae bacterium]|nr:ABC-2 family transporter protein [Lachnospiraceae bacterium]
SWGDLVTGLAVLIYAWVKLGVGLWCLPIVILAVVSGCFIYAGISILLSTVSFFTIAQADVADFTMQIKEIAKYPMTVYPKVLQFIFTFIFPVAFVAFLPVRVIMGDMGLPWAVLIPVIAGVFYWLSKKVWQIGLRHYGSSGT